MGSQAYAGGLTLLRPGLGFVFPRPPLIWIQNSFRHYFITCPNLWT